MEMTFMKELGRANAKARVRGPAWRARVPMVLPTGRLQYHGERAKYVDTGTSMTEAGYSPKDRDSIPAN
jgi:hypothetical protein